MREFEASGGLTLNYVDSGFMYKGTMMREGDVFAEGEKYTFRAVIESEKLVPAGKITARVNGNLANKITAGEFDGQVFVEYTFTGKHTHVYGAAWKSDATNHWHECSCGAKNGTAAHSFGSWKITKAATENAAGSKERTCSVCKYKAVEIIPKLTPTHTHSFGTAWKTSASQHWHECSCGEKSGIANHSFIWKTDKAAAVGVKGLKHEECTVCGYKKAAVEIPALAGHTHSFTVAVAGKSGVKKCTGCNMLCCNLGDVDGDGILSAADARLALRQAVKLENLGGIALKAANADGDAQISSADARLILRASVKLEDASKWNIVNFTA